MKRTAILLSILPVCLHAGEVAADSAFAEIPPASSGWDISSVFYAPLMGLEGSIGLAGIGPVDVDTSFGDILDAMDAGLSGAVEFKNGPWMLQADAIWLKLSDSMSPLPATRFHFGQEQFMGSVSAGYEFFHTDTTSLRFMAGAAINHLKLDLDFIPPAPLAARSRSGSQTWVDPFVGLGVRKKLDDRWTLFADGMYGGFDVSSDEYWQVVAGVGYRLTDTTSIALAYRAIAMDYQQGGFVYDAKTSGPNIGLVVEF